MTTWKAFNGRVTLFPASVPPGALELFRLVWGGDPDSFQKQANPLLPAVALGKRDGMTTICAAGPARVDFTLAPIRGEESPDTSLDLIEDPSQVQTELLRIIEVIGRGAVPESVFRVAVTMQFVKPELSSVEANMTLTRILPDQYRMRLTDEGEFIFQVNQQKLSRDLADIRMNYITKWSVERFQVLALSFRLTGSLIPAPESMASEQQSAATLAASVLFDNNNVPASTPLTGRQQSILLLEGLHAIAKAQNEMGLNGKDAST
jgi:hypothetical protein